MPGERTSTCYRESLSVCSCDLVFDLDHPHVHSGQESPAAHAVSRSVMIRAICEKRAYVLGMIGERE